MSGLVLLSSYPKSGNTWFRIVINSVWQNGTAIDINAMDIANAADRNSCNRILGVSTADLNLRELAEVRPRIYEFANRESDWRKYLKVHDAWLPPLPGAPPPFSEHSVAGVIYIVRDPRDVAVSLADHLGQTIDETIAMMGDPRAVLSRQSKSLPQQVPQFLSSWSLHVRGWLDHAPFRTHLVRYEDMLADPETVFGDALEFADIDTGAELLKHALHNAHFDALKAQEAARGFIERPLKNEKFFRRGKANGWKSILTVEQAARIERDHETVMSSLGYEPAATGGSS